jgi:DNA-binding transcriptional regulator YdaS (Cro superfamily)
MSRRRSRTLRKWFSQRPSPMTKLAFAKAIGVSPSYVSQLTSDDPPWPGRDLARRIGVVTKGQVTPNDLAGYSPRGESLEAALSNSP